MMHWSGLYLRTNRFAAPAATEVRFFQRMSHLGSTNKVFELCLCLAGTTKLHKPTTPSLSHLKCLRVSEMRLTGIGTTIHLLVFDRHVDIDLKGITVFIMQGGRSKSSWKKIPLMCWLWLLASLMNTAYTTKWFGREPSVECGTVPPYHTIPYHTVRTILHWLHDDDDDDDSEERRRFWGRDNCEEANNGRLMDDYIFCTTRLFGICCNYLLPVNIVTYEYHLLASKCKVVL
jgi:hypothetical protein